MSSALYLCFGANAGARVETLLQAAVLAGKQLGASSIHCSSIYADRHSSVASGSVVNMVALVSGVSADEASVRPALERIEHEFGRIRDEDRQAPVTLDIDWIGTNDDGVVMWSDRYDRGRSYVWQGLYELDDTAISPELNRICLERDFTPEENAKHFYQLVSREFTTGFVKGALSEKMSLKVAMLA